MLDVLKRKLHQLLGIDTVVEGRNLGAHSMESFANLVCGELDDGSEIARILSHLRTSIKTFGNKSLEFLRVGNEENLILFGPFAARVIIDNSAAAILGRIDPFRIIYLSRFQSQTNYDPSKRAKSAFGWQGDVFALDKERENLWSEDIELVKISRALFSQHIEHVFWRPAAEASLDFVGSSESNAHVVDFLRMDSESFIRSHKGRGNALYSQLSKGVHWEFFSSSSTAFDPVTIRQAMRDTFAWVCMLALVSHFMQCAHGCLAKPDALQAYLNTLDAINAR